MFAFTPGEIALVIFILALVYGAGVLPRLGEKIAERLGGRDRGPSSRAPLDRG